MLRVVACVVFSPEFDVVRKACRWDLPPNGSKQISDMAFSVEERKALYGAIMRYMAISFVVQSTLRFLFCLWCVFTAAMSIARDDSKRANEVKKAIQRAPSLPSTSNPGQSAQSVHGCHIVLMCLYLPVNACPRFGSLSSCNMSTCSREESHHCRLPWSIPHTS